MIDSHTAGEPTRVVISGGPELAEGPLSERREQFVHECDAFRAAVVEEPRGSSVLVGALLVPPVDPACASGVIFFNNVGAIGMCGHGMIGLITTLAHLGELAEGVHRIETPVGVVEAALRPNGEVSLRNVPSWREHTNVTVEVPGMEPVTGDIAWGGNWFFLTETHGKSLVRSEIDSLVEYCWKIRRALNARGFPEVDHIELCGPPIAAGATSRNFVLCPGKAYDRSPCGTGTSAKLACLAADGKLREREEWIQESIVGSTFRGSFEWLDHAAGKVSPIITGRAYVTSEATLLLDEADPFCWGIPRE